MIHAQNTHIGSTAGATLGNFTEGMIVNAQKTDRSGSLPG
jgi:hypothetical protein